MSKVPYILSHLTEDDVDWLLAAGERREIPAGTVLIAEGQPTEALFIILDGNLSVSIAALDGREIDRIGGGDVVGELSFADARPPSATVTALDDVVVFALARETLTAKVHLDTGFAARFYHALTVFLSDRLRLFRQQTTDTGWQPNDTEADQEPKFLANVHLASARFDSGNANANDPVERQHSKPDFQALIYPGRSGDIQPTKDSPPAFLACAYNDRKDISEGLAEVYLRFKRAGVPVELHIYSSGGHGFGLRASNVRPVGQWIARFEEWLADNGFLKSHKELLRPRE